MKKLLAIVVAAHLFPAIAADPTKLPEGTLLLGEVSHVLTPEQVREGKLGAATKVDKLAERLHGWGFTDEDVAAGRVVVLREGIYWNNVASGIKREMLSAALVPEGLEVGPGNIVEAMEKGPHIRTYTVSRVRAKDREEGHCGFVELPIGLVKGLMGAISLVGPSGAATLYCEGIEKEGWQRPRTYWHKLPSSSATPEK